VRPTREGQRWQLRPPGPPRAARGRTAGLRGSLPHGPPQQCGARRRRWVRLQEVHPSPRAALGRRRTTWCRTDGTPCGRQSCSTGTWDTPSRQGGGPAAGWQPWVPLHCAHLAKGGVLRVGAVAIGPAAHGAAAKTLAARRMVSSEEVTRGRHAEQRPGLAPRPTLAAVPARFSARPRGAEAAAPRGATRGVAEAQREADRPRPTAEGAARGASGAAAVAEARSSARDALDARAGRPARGHKQD
jgi:hypothetical protein